MKRQRFIGIDPGPVPGIVELRCDDRQLSDVIVVQCTANTVVPIFVALLEECSPNGWATQVQIEQFVVGRRASRSSTAAAGADTRQVIARLQAEMAHDLLSLHLKPAGAVKPWATDVRLERSGLDQATKGMRHARDAARHALYLAVHEHGLTDPLSKEWRTA